MDSELREILQSMQASLQSMDKRLGAVETRLDGVDSRFDAMEHLIIDVKESLEREIGAVKSRMDIHDARMERQGAYLQAGSRWIAKTGEWAEKVDSTLSATSKEIAEIKQRIQRLEKKSA